jgi:hypothetical protein
MDRARSRFPPRSLHALLWLAFGCACTGGVREPPRNPEKLVDTDQYEPASDDDAPVRAPPPRYGDRIVKHDVAPCTESSGRQKRATDARCALERRKPRGTKPP